MFKRAFLVIPAQAYVANMVQSLVELPARQEPASFTVDQVLKKLEAAAAANA
jgi:arylsulfatase